MNIKATFEGQELEFEMLGVDTKTWPTATHYLSNDGYLAQVRPGSYCETLFLRLIRKRHTFGGVVFEETGESRVAKTGDWTFFAGKSPTFWEHDDLGGAFSVILRHVPEYK